MRLRLAGFRQAAAASAVVMAIALVAAACGSSGSSDGATTGSSATSTYKVGVLVDATGAGASGNSNAPKGAQAYVNYINSLGGINGAKVSMTVADTTSTAAGTLTAAQRLVEQDHVFAVIVISSYYAAAQTYMLKAGVPAIGLGFDGPEWNDPTQTNLFTYDHTNPATVYSTLGAAVKSQGGTKCATVGLEDLPTDEAIAKNFQLSCKSVGLDPGYLGLIKFGATDVGPLALQIKASGADALYLPVLPSQGFSIAAALAGLGVHMKTILFTTGYGGDLLDNPAGVKAAQGYSFTSLGQPTELNTAATQLQSKWFASVGVKGDPSEPESIGWTSMAVFAAGMKAAGPNASNAVFTKDLRAVTGFTAGGLLPAPVAFADYNPKTSCTYVVTLKGSTFVPVSTKPFCGGIVGTQKL